MANDPNTIQYVIQEDGFWYVASKDRTPGVPEIVVSAKGVANGLSEEYNDGWDFGPDSYNPTSTSAIPYTQTIGIAEASAYAYTFAQSEDEVVLVKCTGGVFNFNENAIFSPVSGINGGYGEGSGFIPIYPNVAIDFNGAVLNINYVSTTTNLFQLLAGNSGIYYGYIKNATINFLQQQQSEYVAIDVGSGFLKTQVDNITINGIVNGTAYIDYAFEMGSNCVVENSGASALNFLKLTGGTGRIFRNMIIGGLGQGQGGSVIDLTYLNGSTDSLVLETSRVQGLDSVIGGTPPSNSYTIRQFFFTNNILDSIGSIVGIGSADIKDVFFVSNYMGIDTYLLEVGGSSTSTSIANNIYFLSNQIQGIADSLLSFTYSTISNTQIIGNTIEYAGSVAPSDIFYVQSNATLSNLIMRQNYFNLSASTSTGAVIPFPDIEIGENNWVLPSGITVYSSQASGTTAGTITQMVASSKTFNKKLIIVFAGYENDTTTNQTVDFALPFTSYAVITGNSTGLTISATTSGITITAPDATTTYSGIVIVEGY